MGGIDGGLTRAITNEAAELLDKAGVGDQISCEQVRIMIESCCIKANPTDQGGCIGSRPS